jgi:hypothetical protein
VARLTAPVEGDYAEDEPDSYADPGRHQGPPASTGSGAVGAERRSGYKQEAPDRSDDEPDLTDASRRFGCYPDEPHGGRVAPSLNGSADELPSPQRFLDLAEHLARWLGPLAECVSCDRVTY